MNIDSNIFKFLTLIKNNNNRLWFQQNKDLYYYAKQKFENFVDYIIPQIARFDKDIGLLTSSDCTYRIYRDIRFSNDKTPYKVNFGAFFVAGGKKSNKAGYYLHIEPGENYIGGGLYMPPADILKIIRKEIYDNIEEFLEIVENKTFKGIYKEFDGPTLKTAPKGFPKEWPYIEYLKYLSYTTGFSISESEMGKDNFSDKLLYYFEIMSPFVKFFNKALENL